MDQNDFIVQLFKRPILEHTRFMNFFYGKVESVEDKLKKGRALLTIPQLKMDTQDKGVWAWPPDIKGMKKLKVGDWVTCYFIANNPNDCHIQGKANNIDKQIVKAYDGMVDVLYEDNKEQIKIVYDEQKKEMTIQDQQNKVLLKQNGGEIDITPATLLKMFGGTEAFVKGTTLQPALNTFINIFATGGTITAANYLAFLNALVAGGVALLPFTTSGQMLSTKVKAE